MKLPSNHPRGRGFSILHIDNDRFKDPRPREKVAQEIVIWQGQL